MSNTMTAPNRFTAGILKAMDQQASQIEALISQAYRDNDPNGIREGSEALALLGSVRSQLGGTESAGPRREPRSEPKGEPAPKQDRSQPQQSRRRRGRGPSKSASASGGKKVRTLSQKEKDRRREVKLAALRGDFTAPEVLRPYLLCAIHNLTAKGGGPVKFQEAQRAMVDIMEPKGILKDGDKQFITGSTRPRHMAQTAAMRRKLLLEGVIRMNAGPNGEALDELTDKGFEELKKSIAADSIDGTRAKKARSSKKDTVKA